MKMELAVVLDHTLVYTLFMFLDRTYDMPSDPELFIFTHVYMWHLNEVYI